MAPGPPAAGRAALAQNASDVYVEDTFENAAAAALSAWRRLSEHAACTTVCGPWIEREPPHLAA